MKNVILDLRANEKTVYTLENMGFNVVPTVKIDNLYDDVATHADMQIAYMGGDVYVSSPEVYDYYRKKLIGSKVICGNSEIGGKYPYDICYNTAVLGNMGICYEKYTDKILLSHLKKVINVRQGYSKCSTCIVSKNAIITADTGIYKAAESNGIEVLYINNDGIHLRSGRIGFIGGVSGLIDKGTLAFNGDINRHSDSNIIKDFCKNKNVEIVCLKDGELEDIGTITVNYDI